MGAVGGFILNATREVARIYVTAHLAARLIRVSVRQYTRISKEGNMAAFGARDVNLQHLGLVQVSYPPKDIHTEAVQVTPENIGKLALEFEQELLYAHDSGRPFFVLIAQRFNLRGQGDDLLDPKNLRVLISDWIVPLWGELHVYRDGIFKNTFTFDPNTGGPDIMQAARHSSDTALSAFAEKVSNMKFAVPPEMVKPHTFSMSEMLKPHKFSVSDRVYDNSSHMRATVTVLDVDLGNGMFGIEIKLDDGTYRQVREEVLDYVPDSFKPNVGEIEGPSGTTVMPQVREQPDFPGMG